MFSSTGESPFGVVRLAESPPCRGRAGITLRHDSLIFGNARQKSQADQAPSELAAHQEKTVRQCVAEEILHEDMDSTIPFAARQSVARLHQNQERPDSAEFLRYFAFTGASAEAIIRAKKRRCAVCLRSRVTKPSMRPAKHVILPAFNGLVFLYTFYIQDRAGVFFPMLGMIDDAKVFHVVVRLEGQVAATVPNGFMYRNA